MIATIHIADVGVRRALTVLARPPRDGSIPGLRHADVGICAPFGTGAARPPQFGRVALFGFWDGDDAIDEFLASHRLAAMLSGGWRVRLEPLRGFGSWPGVPYDLRRGRSVAEPGPFAVLTLAQLRPSQAIRFFRTNAKAEEGVLDAPGNIWATAVARPPFLATCSLWESEEAISAYAFRSGSNHAAAITEQARQAFHKESAFVRFRPYRSEGGLEGRNPVPSSWMTGVAAG